MNLGQLITQLEAADPSQTVAHGFTHPHSYRGDYMDLAFEPATDVTVADMLADARSAVGATFQGWKGGEFTMAGHTWCWLSEEGDASGETISALLLDLMLGAPASSAAAAPTDQAAPADWIDGHPQLEAIAAAVWEQCGRSDSGTCVEDDPRNIAVAALAAVLPAPADRAAVLREAADWFEGDGRYVQQLFGHQAAAALRRMAAESAPADTGHDDSETEAHPAEHKWAAELYDPLAEEWVPGTRYKDRDRAVNHLAHAAEIGPTWKDGTPTERRLVRATTTYTVEAEHTPAVEQPAAAQQPKEA